jgi:hypothetical protein
MAPGSAVEGTVLYCVKTLVDKDKDQNLYTLQSGPKLSPKVEKYSHAKSSSSAAG